MLSRQRDARCAKGVILPDRGDGRRYNHAAASKGAPFCRPAALSRLLVAPGAFVREASLTCPA
jgi:hypothetical protein